VRVDGASRRRPARYHEAFTVGTLVRLESSTGAASTGYHKARRPTTTVLPRTKPLNKSTWWPATVLLGVVHDHHRYGVDESAGRVVPYSMLLWPAERKSHSWAHVIRLTGRLARTFMTLRSARVPSAPTSGDIVSYLTAAQA
jgi:hypothetical protein